MAFHILNIVTTNIRKYYYPIFKLIAFLESFDLMNISNKQKQEERFLLKVMKHVIEMADYSSICDCSVNEMKDFLHKRLPGVPINIIQRNIPKIGVRYNIIEYFDEITGVVNHVITIRGTRNFKNLKIDLDSTLEYDSSLDMYIHRGFKKVYQAILQDLLNINSPTHDVIRSHRLHSSQTIRLTGHSLGGVCACLLAAALNKNHQIKIESVIVFGVPKFTDLEGSHKLAHLPLTLVEHSADPIITIPSPSGYHHLRPKQLITLQHNNRIFHTMNPLNNKRNHEIFQPKLMKYHFMSSYKSILRSNVPSSSSKMVI